MLVRMLVLLVGAILTIAPSAPLTMAVDVSALDRLGDAVQTAGEDTMASGLFSGVYEDATNGIVDVYVTDPARASELLAATTRTDPGVDLGPVRILSAAHSLASLTAARARLEAVAASLPYTINGLAIPPDGSALDVRTSNAAAAELQSKASLAALRGQSAADVAGVGLTFSQGEAATPADRSSDGPPFIGGDFITSGNSFCTAGIPVEDSSGLDFLVTANHCFAFGSIVTTVPDAVSPRRFTVGEAENNNWNLDVELLLTGRLNGRGTNADVGLSDAPHNGINFKPLTSTGGTPANNRSVCQDGFKSFALHFGVPCGLVVRNNNDHERVCSFGRCAMVPEVKTEKPNHGHAVSGGDSGAVVFSIPDPRRADRQARGMVDLEAACTNHEACSQMFFVPANLIYRQEGVHLNPHR